MQGKKGMQGLSMGLAIAGGILGALILAVFAGALTPLFVTAVKTVNTTLSPLLGATVAGPLSTLVITIFGLGLMVAMIAIPVLVFLKKGKGGGWG